MRFASIVGARPQFIKVAVVSHALRQWHEELLIHTGQHYDYNMSAQFFEELAIPVPDYHLECGSGTHGAQTGRMLEAIEQVLMKEHFDWVIVYGDTNSTLAGALAAAKLHIPVAHVESGLRSFNRQMPEEINRIATDHISEVLFCPTEAAVEQLEKEGITRNVYFTGDVMLDAVQEFAPLAEERSKVLNDLKLSSKKYILVTIHRAENTDSLARIEELVDTLCLLKYPTVFSMHPRLRVKLEKESAYRELWQRLKQASHLKITPPVSYLDMLHLERNAMLVMTDSGGVQKESYFVA